MPQATNVVLCSRDQSKLEPFPIQTLVIAGWTGRDQAAVEKHSLNILA